MSDTVKSGIKKVKHTPKSIKRRLAAYDKKVQDLEIVLKQIHLDCPHVSLTRKSSGSSGNWDRTEFYWYEWKCPDCRKFWTTAQTYEEREKYPHAIDITY